MKEATPSLFATLLRTVADWADTRRDGEMKPSARSEGRRRARQRLKDRAALADFFRGTTRDLGAQVDSLRQVVDGLAAEREQLRQQIETHRWIGEDLGRRNVELMDLCASAQHEAEHWKRFVEDERSREAKFDRMIQ